MHYLQFSKKKYKEKRIVLGIGKDAPIDPEETKKEIKDLFKETSEYIEQQKLIAKKNELVKEQYDLNNQYNRKANPRTGKFVGSKKEKEKIHIRYLMMNKELEKLEQKLIDHAKITENVYRNLFRKNAVYSAPRNAKLLTIEETQKWMFGFQNLKQGKILLEDGSEITKDEFEKERISQLSSENKLGEMKMRLAEKTGQAIQMRNSLEIQGDEKALEKSQKWFKAEKVKIEELYS